VHDRLLWSRRLVRSALARTLAPVLPVDRHLVLGYHRVVERFDREAAWTMPASLVSRRMLERHLDCIGRHHEFVSLDELGTRLTERRRNGRPLAAVTFDDGYRDVYDNALPMLTRKGIPAAVFVVTDLVGTTKMQTHDRLHALLRSAFGSWTAPALLERMARAGVPETGRLSVPRSTDAFGWTRALLTGLSNRSLHQLIALLDDEFGGDRPTPEGLLTMTWAQVVEAHRAGFTIGSHTQSHVLLTNESGSRVFEEVAESRRELERRLGAPVAHFAYPDGRFNRTAVKAVRLAGYRFAFTTCRHRDRRDPLLTIPRRVLWEHSAVDTRGQFAPAVMRYLEQNWAPRRQPCSWQSHA
jgi:peptidoglycan/xylan/chitin deacetylase (PgdA/CDA1 family)